jgi:hypothetical protein
MDLNLVTVFFIILGLLVLVVLYQSRHEPFSFGMYVQRFVLLLTIIYQYCKDAGLYMAQQFRQINWDLARGDEVPPQLPSL